MKSPCHSLANFPLSLLLLFPSQGDRPDAEFVFVAGASASRKAFRETQKILVRASARWRRSTIYHLSSGMRQTGQKNVFSRRTSVPAPFSFTRIASEGATRIDPFVARNELPANAPPKQIFASEKETFPPSRVDVLKRFARSCPPAARYTRNSSLWVSTRRRTYIKPRSTLHQIRSFLLSITVRQTASFSIALSLIPFGYNCTIVQ